MCRCAGLTGADACGSTAVCWVAVQSCWRGQHTHGVCLPQPGHALVCVSVCHSLQAASDLEGNVRHVAALMEHPAFDITKPPACEHLLLGFADSVPNFHAEDGSGYAFMADAVLKVGCC